MRHTRGARGWMEPVGGSARQVARSHPVRRQARGSLEQWFWRHVGRGYYAMADPSRSATSLTTASRAARLSLAGMIVQGAAAVLVRAIISFTASL